MACVVQRDDREWNEATVVLRDSLSSNQSYVYNSDRIDAVGEVR
jgi:hypothetical protein